MFTCVIFYVFSYIFHSVFFFNFIEYIFKNVTCEYTLTLVMLIFKSCTFSYVGWYLEIELLPFYSLCQTYNDIFIYEQYVDVNAISEACSECE